MLFFFFFQAEDGIRDKLVTAAHPVAVAHPRRCGDSRPLRACRRCCELRSGTARCGRCQTVFVARGPHRGDDPFCPTLVFAPPAPEAAQLVAARVRARRLPRSSVPPGTREPASLMWHYTTQPIILRRRFSRGSSSPKGNPPAWPKSVVSPGSTRSPRASSRHATSCSRTFSAAECWRPPPSIRKNGSTTPCCTSPIVLPT